jgi:hypothetical protein
MRISDTEIEKLKAGSVIVSPPLITPNDLLFTLVNLASGEIFPPQESIKERGYRCFLPEFVFLPDILLHHERIMLPEASQIHPFLIEHPIIKDLIQKEILYPLEGRISDRIWCIDTVDDYLLTLPEFSGIDKRTALYNIIMNPDRYKNWLQKKRITPSGPLQLRNLDVKQIYDAFLRDPINTGGLSNVLDVAMALSSEMSVIGTANGLPSSHFLNTLIQQYEGNILSELKEHHKSAYHWVLEELEGVRKSIHDELLKGGIISKNISYKIPFGLAVILRDVTHPTDLFDVMLEKRDDRSIRKFRTWLGRYDEVLKAGNLGQITHAASEIKFAAQQLRKEFETFNTNKLVTGYSDLISDAIDISLTAQPPKKLIDRVLGLLDGKISKWRYPHLYYMEELGRAGIDISVKKDLNRIFGDQGSKFADFLYSLGLSVEKVKEIEKLPFSPWYIPKPEIRITDPTDGSDVPLCGLIKGVSSISFNLSPLTIYVCVYSHTDNKWTVNGPPAIIYPNGGWKAFCTFKGGLEMVQEDNNRSDQRFKICAIITIKRFKFYNEWGLLLHRPDGIALSPVISVTRSKNYTMAEMEKLRHNFLEEFRAYEIPRTLESSEAVQLVTLW